ncbi:MAG: HEAT repeat domain-containing protein [Acidobacteriia bacterium]|nr:HEAT repeat domain-containing protein [Terriglobia bacterium]
MNCDWTRENIVLYVYDELADDAVHSLEQHTRSCAACRQELESALELKGKMSAALPVEEISANLLAATRMKLQESLEHAEQSRGLGRFVFDLSAWMHQLKLAPALTAALLMIGFAGGSLTTWRIASHVQPPIVDSGAKATLDADIVDIDSIEKSNDNRLSIGYKTQQRQTFEGAVDDPNTHQLLLLGSSSKNRDVQMKSIELLGKKAQDTDVREALINSLRFDNMPAVRLECLRALRGYVKSDVRVRDAMVEALVHDSNPGVRNEAIRLLDQVRADTSVREALQSLSRKDKDPNIRAEAKRVLANSPTLY